MADAAVHTENRAVEALDTLAAARILGLTGGTLRKMRITGRGPRFMKLGKAVRYRVSDLEAYIAANSAGSTSEYSK